MLFDGPYRTVARPDRATPPLVPFCQLSLPGFRELDFFIGERGVSDGRGAQRGTSSVRSDRNACLLEEQFVGRNGYLNQSVPYWDFAEDRWSRNTADNLGGSVQLSGVFDGQELVLVALDELASGETVLVRNRMTVTAGGVTQRWRLSRDGEASWLPNLDLPHAAQ